MIITITRSSYHATSSPWRTCQNLERVVRPVFLALKFGEILFFCVGKFISFLLGFHKISAIFWVWQIFSCFFGSSNFCTTHLNPLNEERTFLKIIKPWELFIFIQNLTNNKSSSMAQFFLRRLHKSWLMKLKWIKLLQQ